MDKETAIAQPSRALDKLGDNDTLDDQELGIAPVSMERIERVYRWAYMFCMLAFRCAD